MSTLHENFFDFFDFAVKKFCEAGKNGERGSGFE
jgi:hypothetical protein